MKIKNSLFILLLILLLSSCDNNANENEGLTIDTQKLPLSGTDVQSKKAVNDAIKALNNVEPEFLWKDTHLILKKSQKALTDGDFELSTELANKVIQQAKLMHEQKEFADKHWQNLMPAKESK